MVDLARLAPSVHNTQPWAWRLHGSVLELRADRTRWLPVADPDGRNLHISCGAALQHAVSTARAMRLDPHVERLPDHRDPDLLARLDVRPGDLDRAAEQDLLAMDERCTDRRRFTSWPVPQDRVERLAATARLWGTEAFVLSESSQRFRAELLLERARLTQLTDPAYREETRAWVGERATDGVPVAALPRADGRPGQLPHRFDDGLAPFGLEALVETSEGLLVLATTYDAPAAWLSVGEGLSALWLQATREGLSVVPLSQLTEQESGRRALDDVLTAPFKAQIMVRVGWQEISRSTLPRTPRRPLEDVLTEVR